MEEPKKGKRRGRLIRFIVLFLGVACILAGGYFIASPFIQLNNRSNADKSALANWNENGDPALAGAVPSSTSSASSSASASPTASPATDCGGLTSSSDAYALIEFPSLNYAGVAGNGDWSMLYQRSMVHYDGSPGPGQAGNMIVAFHREPNYYNMNQLNVGDTITVQSRTCQVYKYQITQKWTEAPADVTQLVPTSGYQITLITCTPWWQDYNRLVFRGVLEQ